VGEPRCWQEDEIAFASEVADQVAHLILNNRRRRTEEILLRAQKMESIGTLAGGIAHDFNNILAAIIGYTELSLLYVEKESLFYDNLQEVLKSGLRAKDLVGQILAFSRQSTQELKPLRLKPVVDEALKMLRASLPSTVEIRQNIQADSTVLADPTQIHQVLMNLCSNSAQAMERDGGVLSVEMTHAELDAEFTAQHPSVKPGDYLKLTVSDTGHGISSEIIDRIFDPFFTTKKKGKGTGMGLSVVHGILKNHGGTVTVYSKPGKGSTFNVFLPAIEEQTGTERRFEENLPGGTERILFVDDEKAIVDISRQTLEFLGYDVVTTTSSVEALELFRSKPDEFDLVIVDMTMPNMTGEVLVKEITRVRPDMPAILCSGLSAMTSEDNNKKTGIRAVVTKPTLRRELAEIVRRVLDS
jgi:signal transduction histidine kinase